MDSDTDYNNDYYSDVEDTARDCCCPEDKSERDLNNTYFNNTDFKDEDYFETNESDSICNHHTQWDGDSIMPIRCGDSESEDDSTHKPVPRVASEHSGWVRGAIVKVC